MRARKVGPYRPRLRKSPIQWTSDMDAKTLRLSDAGKAAVDIAAAIGLASRSILRRQKALRGGNAAETTRKVADPFGLRTPETRQADAAIAIGLRLSAFDDGIEWLAWGSRLHKKLAVKDAAGRLGIGVPTNFRGAHLTVRLH